MPADRVLAVVEKPFADKEAWALAAVAFFWHRAREAGTSEEQFRAMLRADPDLGLYADQAVLPVYRPARIVTREEAGKLLARGIAVPVVG